MTNTTAGPLTVLGAGVASPLFSGTIEWQATPGGIELPPGQTKILPAQLRAPACGLRTAGDQGAAVERRSDELRLAAPAERGHRARRDGARR